MSNRRSLGGIFAAWIFSLLVALAGWMIRRAIKAQNETSGNESGPPPRRESYPEPHIQAPSRYASVQDTICQGMSEEYLVSTYGRPAHTLRTRPGREIWTYPETPLANDNAPLTVILENGQVTDWSESVTSH